MVSNNEEATFKFLKRKEERGEMLASEERIIIERFVMGNETIFECRDKGC